MDADTRIKHAANQEIAGSVSGGDMEQIFSKYGLEKTNAYSSGVLNSLYGLFADSKIPESRKQAMLAEIRGLSSSLPEQSWLDQLSNVFIGTSNYQKAMNQFNTDVGAIIARYQNMDYEEDYNSAASMAQRENQAGINTELSGVSAQAAGEAANYDEQGVLPKGIGQDLGVDVPGFMSTIYQVGSGLLSGIIGIADKVLGWQGKEIQNAIGDITLDKETMNQVSEYLARTFSTEKPDFDAITGAMNNFGYSGDVIKSFDELDKFINDFNSSDKIKGESDKISRDKVLGQMLNNAISTADLPYISSAARKRWRKFQSDLKDSSFVKGLAKKYENAYTSNDLEQKRLSAIVNGLSDNWGKFVSKAYNLATEAESEYNKWYLDYQKKMNSEQSFIDSDGNQVSGTVNDAEINARFVAAVTAKQKSISDKLQANLEQQSKEFQEEINKLVDDSWMLKDTVLGGFLKMIVPTLLGVIKQGAGSAANSWGTSLFAPPPAPRITNNDTHKYTTVTNNYGQ